MSDRIDAFATATDMLTGAPRAATSSAVELLDLHRRRIEQRNPELNALVEPDFERARATRRRPTRSGRAARTRRCAGCR